MVEIILDETSAYCLTIEWHPAGGATLRHRNRVGLGMDIASLALTVDAIRTLEALILTRAQREVPDGVE